MLKSSNILAGFLTLLIFSMMIGATVPQFADESRTQNLRWKKRLIPIALSNSLLKPNSAIRPESDVSGAIRRSLDTWEAVANIEFQETWTDKLSVSPTGPAGDGVNLITIAQTPENLLMFGGDTEEVSARTKVFFNRQGTITEADIVFNPYQQFSTDGSIGTFDLESTLTHEIGHLLGLDHSAVFGATMNEHQAKNGVFNLSNFSNRTLAEVDIAEIRGIYGANSETSDCCGSLSGKISSVVGKPQKNAEVWLEERESGRVSAETIVNPDGGFKIEGISEGKYRVYLKGVGKNTAVEDLGEVEIFSGKTSLLNKKINESSKDFDLQYIGFGGQLSTLAVPLNSGKTYVVYLGGKNLQNALSAGINSPYFSVAPETFTRLDFGNGISAISLEIKIDPNTPNGEYTVFLQNKNGATDTLVGGLTIEKFLNPWSSYF